jgi:hypothetical protein
LRDDAERWNRRYDAAAEVPAPDPLLDEYRHLFGGAGLAIDVAAGRCANAVRLAELGYDAVAVDISESGLRAGLAHARGRGVALLAVVADLDRFPLPSGRFGVVAVFRYLNRALFPALTAALIPGGLLVYRTFNRNFLSRKPDFNPRYLLEPGELVRAFDHLEPIATNDGDDVRDHDSWLIARRP